MKTMVKSALLALCAALLSGGCVPAPRRGDGRLTLRVSWETRAFSRSLEEISAVNAVLSRQSLQVVVPLAIDPAGGSASGTATGLYAGEWTVRVDAAMADGTVIYTGETKVTIDSGEAGQVEMTLEPAPGRLALTMDVAPLLAAGEEFAKGTVYVYGADSAAAATEDLALDGTTLSGVVDLPPQTYDAKVAIPNTSDAIFTSAYFTFDILPGRTTTVSLGADGALSVDISIAVEPERVTGLAVAADSATATLTWNQAARATGYRVYRTDKDGRFRGLAEVEGGAATAFTDDTFGAAEPYDGKVRYAVAAMAGTIEGLRSEPVEVPVG